MQTIITLAEAVVDNSSGVFEAASSLVARGVQAIWVGGDVTVMVAFEALVTAARDGVGGYVNAKDKREDKNRREMNPALGNPGSRIDAGQARPFDRAPRTLKEVVQRPVQPGVFRSTSMLAIRSSTPLASSKPL